MILTLATVMLGQSAKTNTSPVIYDIEIAPNDQWMAISNSSDNVWIYTLQGKLLRTLHHKSGSHLVDIEISPNGKFLACTNVNFNGDYSPVWSTSSWKEISKLGIWATKSFCDPAISIEFADGGKYVIGPSAYSHEMICWNTETGAIAYMAKKVRTGYYGFAINSNSSLALLREAGVPRMRFWDFLDSRKSRDWGAEIDGLEPKFVKQNKFSHDGRRMFMILQVQKGYCTFYILQPANGRTKIAVQDQVQNFQPRDCAWAGDDSLIWVAGLNGQIVCFDPRSGVLRRHWTGHNGGAIHALAATNHGRTVVTSSGMNVCVWDGNSGQLIRTIQVK